MSFEWDDKKNRANRVKHGMDFDFAWLAFDDPFAITTQDRDVSGEQRPCRNARLLPANSVEEESVIRIISVRRADSAEKETL